VVVNGLQTGPAVVSTGALVVVGATVVGAVELDGAGVSSGGTNVPREAEML
jgi:hypothetical protein